MDLAVLTRKEHLLRKPETETDGFGLSYLGLYRMEVDNSRKFTLAKTIVCVCHPLSCRGVRLDTST